jgi:hypothetical protein
MSTDANQYNNYVVFNQSDFNGYWVKVSYQPKTTSQTVFPSSQEYVTRHYLSAEQASMDARGWIDCTLYYEGCRQIPNDNEDSYAKRLRELLDELENRFTQDINNSRVSKEERELAYREGWKSKLEQLKSMEIRNSK